MSSEAVILLLFAVLNVAALFYRRSFSLLAAIYIAAWVLLYATFLFLDGFGIMAMVLYIVISSYIIIKEKRWLVLYFALVNMFLCGVVITETAGNSGGLTIAMFFTSEPDLVLLNTIHDTAGMAWVFMCLGAPVFLLINGVRYFMRWRRERG